MKFRIDSAYFKPFLVAVVAVFSAQSYAQTIIPGGSGWADSYSVDGKCYCASTYDHGIGSYTVDTPAGVKTVVEVCEAIGAGPGKGSNPIYNTVQCGHAPAHTEEGNFRYTDGITRYVADEVECPGRVDSGPEGCTVLGPQWDLSVFGSSELSVPGRIEAENYTAHLGTETQSTQDQNGGLAIGHIEQGDYLAYTVDVAASGSYEMAFRVASPRTNTVMTLSIDGEPIEDIDIPHTGGWENWTTITRNVTLNVGIQTLQLDFNGVNGGLLNINWIETNSDSAMIELNNSNWTLSSSINENDLYNAIDGNNSSRWTSYRQVQQNGQTFTIDLNANTLSYDRIVLDSSNSANDQPRGYSIHVSNDGSSWGSAISTGEGDSSGITTIDFSDQNARFIRITQTGSATRNWWSIHELSIFANSN